MYSPKICPICNKKFIPNSSKQKYCKQPIELVCAVCGDKFEGQCSPDNISVCSKKECKQKAASVGAQSKTKICRTCGKEFKPNSSRQLDCNRPVKKVCKVCGATYIGRCSQNDLSQTCSEECTQKLACINRMESVANSTTRICKLCGKEFHPTNNTQIICKNEHYRDCVICGTKFKVDTRYNSREWAVTCSRKCHAILANNNKSQETIDRMTAERRNIKYKDHPDKLSNYLEFLEDPVKYLESHYSKDNPATIYKLCDDFMLHDSTVGVLIERFGVKSYVKMKASTMEQEVMRFIENIKPEAIIIHNTRKVITPYELDIYLPEYDFAVECNPTSTHNSTNHPYDEDIAITPINYHKMKTDLCEAKGIQLLHIFGYDWTHKQDIIKSIIRNVLKCNAKIYARNCIIKEVSASDAHRFLDENHRQGACGATIKLGLYYHDKLVSLMTFGKPRRTIGNNKQDYELLRFCSLKGTTVVGGASRLFKYFISKYNPTSIISYSDRAHTSGSIYPLLGFKEISRSEANYKWVEEKTDRAFHRINAQKHNIKTFLKDNNIDLNQTEVQIMRSHGYVQVFDSGTITWEWRNSLNEK